MSAARSAALSCLLAGPIPNTSATELTILPIFFLQSNDTVLSVYFTKPEVPRQAQGRGISFIDPHDGAGMQSTHPIEILPNRRPDAPAHSLLGHHEQVELVTDRHKRPTVEQLNVGDLFENLSELVWNLTCLVRQHVVLDHLPHVVR